MPDLQKESNHAARQKMEAALRARVRQQAVVSELGQQALGNSDMGALMEQAVDQVARTLGIEYCKVLELLPGGEVFRLRAGVGWQAGLVGTATVNAGQNSQAGYTLQSTQPVIVEDLQTESRFDGAALLHDQGVTSGISVVIGSPDYPFGVLGVHSTRQRSFSPDDVHFVQSIANVLAVAANRVRAERQIRGLNELQARLLRPGTLDEKLKHVTDGVVDIFGADFARFWIVGRGDLCDRGCVHRCQVRDRCLHLVASSGRYTHIDGPKHGRIPFGAFKIGMVAAGQDPGFVTNDISRDAGIQNPEWARELGLVSFGGYRLHSAQRELIGVLGLFSQNRILGEENALLEGLANTTAQVIQAAQAEEALRHSQDILRLKNEYLASLQETSLDLVARLDLDNLLENIVSRAGQLLGTTHGYLDLVEPGTQRLIPRVAVGALSQSLMLEVQPGEGVAGTVWQAGRPVLVNEYDTWASRVKSFEYNTIRAVVGVPLLAGSSVVGVLSLAYDASSDNTFLPQAVELLEQFARLAVIAIDNARLFKQTKDDMRILWRLNAELEKAMAQVKQLTGLLPICSNCKKIRDDDGYWQDVAVYIREHSEAEFTHGICPDCVKELYPELAEKIHPE